MFCFLLLFLVCCLVGCCGVVFVVIIWLVKVVVRICFIVCLLKYVGVKGWNWMISFLWYLIGCVFGRWVSGNVLICLWLLRWWCGGVVFWLCVFVFWFVFLIILFWLIGRWSRIINCSFLSIFISILWSRRCMLSVFFLMVIYVIVGIVNILKACFWSSCYSVMGSFVCLFLLMVIVLLIWWVGSWKVGWYFWGNGSSVFCLCLFWWVIGIFGKGGWVSFFWFCF